MASGLGVVEVELLSASNLKRGDFFSKSDPYVILTHGSQIQKSNTARNQGKNPVWNQKFKFKLEERVSELELKVMDEDFITADDCLGIAKVPLSNVISSGIVPPTSFNVVRSPGKSQGEIKVSLSFTSRLNNMNGSQYYGSQHSHNANESVSSSQYNGHQSSENESDGPYGSRRGGGWSSGSQH